MGSWNQYRREEEGVLGVRYVQQASDGYNATREHGESDAAERWVACVTRLVLAD